jgi:phosphohistidine phosphatase SixA
VNRYLPDAALSSDATRTRQTIQGTDVDGRIRRARYLSALYNASVDAILRHQTPKRKDTVCAHNQALGLQQLA